MAAKIFAVSDVLPATTQLRISWNNDIVGVEAINIYSLSGLLKLVYNDIYGSIYITVSSSGTNTQKIYDGDIDDFIPPYTNYNGNHAYCDIDISTWDISRRTIYSVDTGTAVFLWEDIESKGFNITFEENGGTTQTDLTEQTTLPTPLPTPTKSGYTFVAWYYESNFQTRAKAGDTIESNVTLYAKWHNLGSLFTEIANAIREKESSSGTIRDVDFGERVKQIQPAKEEETKTVTPNFSSGNEVVTPTAGKVLSQVTINKDANFIAENLKKDVTAFGLTGTSYIAIELTQAQYDALGTKDANTYYLIVEVE